MKRMSKVPKIRNRHFWVGQMLADSMDFSLLVSEIYLDNKCKSSFYSYSFNIKFLCKLIGFNFLIIQIQNNRCLSGFTPSNRNDWILGIVVIRAKTFFFDVDNNRIGIGPKRRTTKHTDLLALQF